ncbi:MAG: hypothetical protein WAT66_01870 [Actinomycetota bacterium]
MTAGRVTRRRGVVAALGLALVLLAGCGGSAPQLGAKSMGVKDLKELAAKAASSPTPKPSSRATKKKAATTTSASVSPSPRPSPSVSLKPMPVSASVSPSCVRPGGLATLTVETLPDSVVAYVAIYSNGKSGAAPPWGEGYGGNDGGHANSRGVYKSSWTVSPSAPAGPATVQVVVGIRDKGSETTAHFTVGSPTGACGDPGAA